MRRAMEPEKKLLTEGEWFQVDHGMRDPRDEAHINFIVWDCYAEKDEAQRVARRFNISRVLHIKVVARKGYAE
jgi:hypothetical protein